MIKLGGAAIASACSGCVGFENQPASTVSVSEITIRNRIDREIEVSVLLVEDGDVAYWQSVSVPAGANPFANPEDLPSDPGAYELYAHVLESDENLPVDVDLTDEAGDQSCITIGMAITYATVDDRSVPAVVYGTLGRC